MTGLAGCGSVTNYEFSAPPVVLPTDKLTDENYQTIINEPVVAKRSRTVGDVEVTATVESHVTVYGVPNKTPRGTATEPTFGAVSTPRASVMSRSFNPLARRSLANLPTSATGVRFLQRTGLDEVGHPRSRIRWERGPTLIAGREGTCLGIETRFESYGGVLGGDPPSVAFVHLTRVAAESVVITAAIYGHDIQRPGRSFVGPDSGYLSPDVFNESAGAFADTCTALEYRGKE